MKITWVLVAETVTHDILGVCWREGSPFGPGVLHIALAGQELYKLNVLEIEHVGPDLIRYPGSRGNIIEGNRGHL